MKVAGKAAILLFTLLAGAQGAALAQDAVGNWLEESGLNRLHARRLEQQLDAARDSGLRNSIAQQLAETYAELLETAATGVQRDLLEDRGRAVLEKISDEEGDPLRLALLRSSYSAASRECELYRLALEIGSTREELEQRLASIAENLSEVRKRLERRERVLERRVSRSRGVEAQIASTRADDVSRRIAQATFLEAWSRAYLAWISADSEVALEAQKLFGRILATGKAFPDPSDVSMDLRDDEIYAESILGMAFAKSITDSIATVQAWLYLLLGPDTAEYVRESRPYWELALYAEAGSFGDAIEVLRALPQDAPVSWVRLAAVSGLGARGGGEAAQALGTEAVAMLAAQNELAQVIDLAERFGLAEMDRSGFALNYVSGVCRYEEGRKAAEAGDLEAARRAYRAALEDLDAASAEPDADEFNNAQPGLLAMRAWCLHELGEYEQASALFEEAASLHGGYDAGNLLWKAIVCLDQAKRNGEDNGTHDARQMKLIEQFLDEYPSHPSAPGALLRSLATNPDPSIEDAETLISVSTNSTIGARAHQEGVQMLYRIFRRARGEERVAAGRRFLEVVPVPRFDQNDDSDVHLFEVIRARQLLDVALMPRIAASQIAAEVIAAVDRGVNSGVIDMAGKERELDFRRLQLALYRDNVAEALRLFRRFEAEQVDDWTKLAARTLFNAASVVVQSEELLPDDTRTQQGIDAVRRTAVVILGDSPENADFSIPENWAMARSLAIAEERAFDSSGALDARDRALLLYTKLSESRGKDEVVLEGLARLSEAAGFDEQALQAHRTLVAGSQPGTDVWFRRKVDHLRVLARVDPSRARQVLQQHVVLHPNYGPEPWGAQLRLMHNELDAGAGLRNGAS